MGALHEGWMIVAALIPSIGLLFLFWVILKHLLEGDRRERAAIRRWEAEQDAAAPKTPAEGPGKGADGSAGADGRNVGENPSDRS